MASSKSSKKVPKKAEPAKDSASTKAKGKSTSKAASNPAPTLAPLALAAVKQVSADGDLDAGIEAEKAAFARVFGSEDAKEGATAFIEKRDPVWKGR